MYVCKCTGVSRHTVAQAVTDGCRTSKEVATACGAGSERGDADEPFKRLLLPLQRRRKILRRTAEPKPGCTDDVGAVSASK